MSTFLCTVNYPDGTSKEFTVENIYKLKYKDFAKQLKISKDQVLILENTIISSDKEFGKSFFFSNFFLTMKTNYFYRKLKIWLPLASYVKKSIS